MHYVKQLLLFTSNHIMQLKRKWLSLPLLLIFPVAIVCLAAIIVITFFTSGEKTAIQIGLVDLDGSEETQLMVQLLEGSSELGSAMQIHSMTEEEAESSILADAISSYIILPDGFVEDLYQGRSVHLPVIGNPDQATESYMVKELMDSVSRHIRSSQASILTINYYAKEFGMESEERNEFVFGQFQEYLFYTIGRDRVIQEESVVNHATSSPVQYFTISAIFIVLSIWLLAFYNLLSSENSPQLSLRMKLYGVTEAIRIVSKGVVTLLLSLPSFLVIYYASRRMTGLEVPIESDMRVFLIIFLYSMIFIQCLALLEMLVRSAKARLLSQAVVVFAILFGSGAILPVIYFPLGMQERLTWLFSHEAYQWIQEVLLNGRFYADYTSLLLTAFAGAFTLFAVSMIKERVSS